MEKRKEWQKRQDVRHFRQEAIWHTKEHLNDLEELEIKVYMVECWESEMMSGINIMTLPRHSQEFVIDQEFIIVEF